VICVDEMGPASAKSYPACRPAPAKSRPPLAPDYGGFELATGQAFTQVAAKRDTACFVAFLDALVACWPTGRIVLILDNLSSHRSLDVRLWALAHEQVEFLF
jgi:hypothetical protein